MIVTDESIPFAVGTLVIPSVYDCHTLFENELEVDGSIKSALRFSRDLGDLFQSRALVNLTKHTRLFATNGSPKRPRVKSTTIEFHDQGPKHRAEDYLTYDLHQLWDEVRRSEDGIFDHTFSGFDGFHGDYRLSVELEWGKKGTSYLKQVDYVIT